MDAAVEHPTPPSFDGSPQELGRRVPRLELPFALGAALAAWLVVTAGLRYELEDVRLGAFLAVLLCAAPVGTLARFCALPPPAPPPRELDTDLRPPRPPLRRRWLGLGAVWLAAGMLVAGALGYVANAGRMYQLESAIASTGVGALGALAILPGCLWVVYKARAAGRARLGSIVAASDRRAVWGALGLVLAAESLAVLPSWFLHPRDPARFAARPVAIGTAVLALGLVGLAASDWLARRRLGRLTALRASLEELDAEVAEMARHTDVGLGAELYGRTLMGQRYRQGRERVPVVRGSLEQASRVVAASSTASAGRALAGCVAAALQLWAANR
ncbi:MAG: hypothetical protein IT373_38535 [Polyangiaceae bacterium]|nr:hypothetical protein [Polyangiaceae bacterium]